MQAADSTKMNGNISVESASGTGTGIQSGKEINQNYKNGNYNNQNSLDGPMEIDDESCSQSACSNLNSSQHHSKVTFSLPNERSNQNQIPSRSHPINHPAADAPFCPTCEQLDVAFFNPECPGCKDNLSNLSISISQIFAIIRQWVPQTQQCIELLAKEILRRGAHVDDRDHLTDMTLLHYTCKAGSSGVGDVGSALKTVQLLVESYGADVSLRCKWTDMTAVHYAVYFDVGPVLEYLLKITKNAFIDDVCRDFDGGTPLHIAAANLCLQSTRILLKEGANVLLKDDLSRTPLDCVPDLKMQGSLFLSESAFETASELKKLLEEATLACIPGEGLANQGPVTGKVVLQALGLNLGDRVIISNTKVGTLRYCGATQFATSIWAGVELDQPEGKNDGTVKGVTYFRCPPNHGIFAPINKISKYQDSKFIKGTNSNSFALIRNVNYPKVNISHITPKVETGLSMLKSKTLNSLEISIGNRIMMIDKRIGIVRFIGPTEFAPGTWYGIELGKPIGKNNGSVNGVKYFECKPYHGIFAPLTRILKIMPERKKLDIDSEDTSSEMSYTLSRTSSMDNEMTPRNSLSFNSLYSPANKTKARMIHLKNQITNSLSPKSNDTWLTVGVNVFYNNSIAVVRYIGTVDFADGTWLGIELRTAAGKNDGVVNGKRYFSCKPNHGLFVRPKKVSVRGINGAKLLPENSNTNIQTIKKQK